MTELEQQLEAGYVRPSTLAKALGVPPQMIHNYASKGVFVRTTCPTCSTNHLTADSVSAYLIKRKEREEAKAIKVATELQNA